MDREEKFKYHSSVDPSIVKFAKANNYEEFSEYFKSNLSSKNWTGFILKPEPVPEKKLISSYSLFNSKQNLKVLLSTEEFLDPNIEIIFNQPNFYNPGQLKIYKYESRQSEKYKQELETYIRAKKFAVEAIMMWTKLKSDKDLEELKSKLEELKK